MIIAGVRAVDAPLRGNNSRYPVNRLAGADVCMCMTKTRISRLLAGVLTGITVVVPTAACSGQSDQTDAYRASPESATAAPATTTQAELTAPIKAVEIADVGTAVVDSRGFTVYSFDGDSATASACVAKCAENWPIVPAPDPVPDSLPGITGQLAVLQRPDGKRQLMLNEHPLYTFVHDTNAGDHNGQAKAFKDGFWHILLATGAPLP